MKRHIEYSPKGVCSVKMIIDINDDIIDNVEIIGGCPGNTKAVCNLCSGMKINDAIGKLKGIDCRGRGTSCPDQLACALESIMVGEK